jgi:drug/metabolite transporter (DMT)-like permease
VESQDPVYEGSRFTFHVSRFTLNSSRLADGALLMVALIWGATFVMVRNAITTYPVLSFLALRFAFAALVLLPVVLLRRHRSRQRGESLPSSLRAAGSTARANERLTAKQSPQPAPQIASSGSSPPRNDYRESLGSCSIASAPRFASWCANSLTPSRTDRVSGRVLVLISAPLLMGIALFAGYALQTFGLRLTTPAKAGFITGLSVVIVPVVSTLALRQRLSRGLWLGVGLATAGLALLSLQADLSVSRGDLLVLGCAVAFACQILLTGRFAPRWDPLLLTFGQIVVVAIAAGAAALLLESPPTPGRSVLFAAAFTGILATSLAFGIQTVAQRFTSSTHTALVFSTEPVFAALFSFLLIGEVLGSRQLVGCGLILAGMITAEKLRTGSAAE